jgi:TetR/AcrR family transcriptional regulator
MEASKLRRRPGPPGRPSAAASTLPADSKERIVACAEEVFARKGFAGARTQEIAELAGVNKAMIYYYFESKEKLLREVLQRILFELIGLSQEILNQNLPPIETLEQFYRGFFRYAARHRNFSRLTTMDLGSEGAYLVTMFENFFRPLFERGVRFIERGVARGEFRPVDAKQFLVSIYGMTISYFADAQFVNILMGEEATAEELIEQRLEHLLDFIFSGLGVKRPKRS